MLSKIEQIAGEFGEPRTWGIKGGELLLGYRQREQIELYVRIDEAEALEPDSVGRVGLDLLSGEGRLVWRHIFTQKVPQVGCPFWVIIRS